MKRDKNILIVLTNGFPFGIGEEFLETEIVYLAKHFDNVIIIAACSDTKNTDTLKRSTPLNVIVHKQVLPKSWVNIDIIKNLVSLDFAGEMQKCFFTKPLLQIPFRVVALLKFMQNGDCISKQLKEIVKVKLVNEEDLFLYSYWFNYAAYGVVKYLRKNSCAVGFSRAHGKDLYIERNLRNYLPLRSVVANGLDSVFFISQHGHKYFKNKVPNSKLLQISRLGTKKVSVSCSSSKDNVFRLLSCSYMESVKRLDIIAEALHDIKDKKIQWTHIGDGAQRDNIENMCRLLFKKSINISCKFLGKMSNSAVYDYYKNNPVDAFINTSDYEGIPVAIMEAISFGVPVIGRNVGGVSEIITKQNGILLGKTVTIEDVTKSILKLIEQPSHNMRQQSLDLWKRKFCASKNYTDFVSKIKKLKKR